MEQLKRAQEMRVDEFSMQKFRESHATIQELTSQIQELQERVNCMNDSREFQDVDLICSRKLSHVPSQPAVVPRPRSVLSRSQSLQYDTWNLSGTQETFFWQSTYNARFITDTLSRNSSLYESKCYRWNPTERLVAKGEEQTGSTIPMPIFARRPSTMNSFSPAKSHRILLLISKDCKCRSFIFEKFPHTFNVFMLEG